ncbi:YppE family protein [Bacillus sp. H-16]|uniref:YppE family protein n=1 Tax=Alteribacter salitolerans TaxID=2912333 RepID=UPI0019630F4A|nr:YppE family protein [Alteribacter salitolerans]MBM7094603.1 YppE family protein [Alteribacter salitolerans]
MGSQHDRLHTLTNQVLELNAEAFQSFEQYAKQKENASFNDYVKPFADRVREVSDEWLPLASQYVTENKPKYIHLKQIEAAHENINITAVTCFQADTKKKRFIETNKSIRYTAEALKTDIEKRGDS